MATLVCCDRPEDDSDSDLRASSKAPASLENIHASRRALRARINEKDETRSLQMVEVLAAPPPAWLALAPAIWPESTSEPAANATVGGGAMRPQGSKSTFEIDGLTLRFQFPVNEIMWLTVAPERDRLVLRRGEEFEIRKLSEDGLVAEEGEPLPLLNYEARVDQRWFLAGWRWLSGTDLVATLNRQSRDGDIVEDSALYFYDSISKKLAPVRLPIGLVNPEDPSLSILRVSGRAVQLSSAGKNTWVWIPELP